MGGFDEIIIIFHLQSTANTSLAHKSDRDRFLRVFRTTNCMFKALSYYSSSSSAFFLMTIYRPQQKLMSTQINSMDKHVEPPLINEA